MLLPVAMACALCLPALRARAATPPDKTKADYALIVGTVWGADNRPVYGVRVIIRRADAAKGGWERISDHQGEFAVRVPVGAADYILRADVKVPKGAKQPEEKVHIDNNERVEVGLHLGK
jgi:hypothetical protein